MEASSPSPKTLPKGTVKASETANGTLQTSDIPVPSISGPNDSVDQLSKLPPGDFALSTTGAPQPFPRLASTDGGPDARRPSVQFIANAKTEVADRSASRRSTRDSGARRFSSPPPPTQFTPRVAFDTFDNRDASDFSLTLSRKHKNYAYSKRSRTFLCGTDANEYSDTALEWLIDELVDDGDEIVCLRVVEKDSKEARDWASGGFGREGREKAYRAEAQRMLEKIEAKNSDDRHINLVLEFSIGKVHEMIQHMIRIYEPAMLVVGTRGKSLSGFQGLMPGSVSKYCLQHSPVPVIVVRPSSKRDKKKRKRLRDPARRGYRDILDKSEDVTEGFHLLDERNRYSVAGADVLSELRQRDAEEEARMVAEAIGYRHASSPGVLDGTPLLRTMSGKSELTTRSARSGSMGSHTSDTADDPKSPYGNLLKSPDMRDIESPEGSVFDSSDDDGYEPVPQYIIQQEEALQKARERAIKAEEEEREAEVERAEKENQRLESQKAREERKKRRAESSAATDTENQGAAAVLGLLDDLQAQEKKKGR